MNDFSKKISEKLKSEAESYTIKTSASDIMKVHEQRKKKKPWYKSLAFLSITPAFATVLLIVILSIQLTRKNPDNPVQNYNIKMEDKSGYAKAAIEIVNGFQMLSNSQTIPSNLKKTNIDNQGFEEVCTAFEQAYPLVDSLFMDNGGYRVTLEKGSFTINEKNFTYKMEIKNYFTLYLNTDLNAKITDESTGYVVKGEMLYFIELEKEYDTEDDEVELSIKMHTSTNNYLHIKSEAASMEYGYCYELYENDELIKEICLEYEIDDDEVECEVEILYNEEEYNFELTHSKQTYKIEYKTSEYKGTILLSIYPTYRLYFEENENISIKFQ